MAHRMYVLYLVLGGVTQWGMSFHFATYVMFLLSNGLTILDASLVNTAYAITLILAEFPTGIIADTWGRKHSFVISCFLIAIGSAVYALSPTFVWFVIAEIIIAIGMTCTTGAFDAWIVDTIAFHGGVIELNTLFVRAGQVRKIGSVLGVIMGSYAAEWFGLRMPWFMSCIVFFVVGVVSITFMREDYFKKNFSSVRESFLGISLTTKRTTSFVRKSPHLVSILVIFCVAMCSVQAYNMQWQPFFGANIKSASQLGWFFVAIVLFSFFGISVSKNIIKRKKNNPVMVLIISLIATGFSMLLCAVSSIFTVSVLMFLIHEIFRGSNGVFFDTYINMNIPSTERASLLSLQALAGHIGMAIGLPISGWIASTFSINSSFITSSIFLIVASLCIATRVTRTNKNNPTI